MSRAAIIVAVIAVTFGAASATAQEPARKHDLRAIYGRAAAAERDGWLAKTRGLCGNACIARRACTIRSVESRSGSSGHASRRSKRIGLLVFCVAMPIPTLCMN